MSVSNTPKKLWSNLKTLMPSKHGKQAQTNLNPTDDSNSQLNEQDMADHANDYFITMGSNLANKNKLW